MLHYSQYHPVSEQFSAFFPMFLPCFSKCAHYRVTLFTLFLVELHKAVRLFVGRLLNRLIPPPPTAVPLPLQGRLIGYKISAPLVKGDSPRCGEMSRSDISPHCGESPFTREAKRLQQPRPPCKGGKAAQPQGGARSAYAKKQRPSADRRCLAWNTIIFSAPDALCRPYTAARPWAPVRCRLPASCFPERR